MDLFQVAYFNNYLYDPKRPQNPEIKPLMSGAVAPPPAQSVDDRRSGGDFDRGGGGGGGGYNRGGNVGGGWNDRGNNFGGGGPRNYGGSESLNTEHTRPHSSSAICESYLHNNQELRPKLFNQEH